MRYDKSTKIKDMRLDISNPTADCSCLSHTIRSYFKQWYIPGNFPYYRDSTVYEYYCMAYLPSFSMDKVAYKI